MCPRVVLLAGGMVVSLSAASIEIREDDEDWYKFVYYFVLFIHLW